MANTITVQLDNFDLTRKVQAIQILDTVNRLIAAESQKESPNLTAIAALAASAGTILSAVS